MTDGEVTSDEAPSLKPNPDWVLDHPEVSDRAYRLYGILSRSIALSTELPPRQELATTLRCSRSTLDRTLAELIDVGAVVLEHPPVQFRLPFEPPTGEQ